MARAWYILHTYSGFEETVKVNMLERIKKAGQEDMFGEILVPTEQVVEMIQGAKRPPPENFFRATFCLTSTSTTKPGTPYGEHPRLPVLSAMICIRNRSLMKRP